jgi:hypothetical protein
MLTKGNNMENKEIISPEFIIFKGDKSFVFGIKGLNKENQKNIKSSINSSEASIEINESNTLVLHAGEQSYSFNLEPYFGFFSPSKFYVGFDFIDEKPHLDDDYRRMFRVQK